MISHLPLVNIIWYAGPYMGVQLKTFYPSAPPGLRDIPVVNMDRTWTWLHSFSQQFGCSPSSAENVNSNKSLVSLHFSFFKLYSSSSERKNSKKTIHTYKKKLDPVSSYIHGWTKEAFLALQLLDCTSDNVEESFCSPIGKSDSDAFFSNSASFLGTFKNHMLFFLNCSIVTLVTHSILPRSNWTFPSISFCL